MARFVVDEYEVEATVMARRLEAVAHLHINAEQRELMVLELMRDRVRELPIAR